MNNEEYIKDIMKMDTKQLLTEVITNPEYLVDSYYNVFGDAINKRYEQLIENTE